MALPPYVVNGNLYDDLYAVQLKNVVMHNFCVPADAAKIQAWLDRTFKTPSGGALAYEAVGDKIFLGLAQIGKLYAEDPAGVRGWTSEIDITVWILARRGLELRWIPAYLFVDSGPALVSGREVWGFPKQLGRFDFSPMGEPSGGPRVFNADGWVVSPYGTDSPARWARVFEVRPKSHQGPSGVLGTLEALAGRLADRVTEAFATAAGGLQTAIGLGSITMAFLKQFPDAAAPSRACYQAVIEAEARITTLRGSGLTDDDYEIRITSYDSHPFFAELGLAPDWQAVGQGIWMDFDFEQRLGLEAHRSV